MESQTLELSIDDPGLLFGATIFTTLRVYDSLDSRLTNWSAHCDRLNFSLQSFGWQQPNWQNVRYGAEILMEWFPVLRITLFPDGREWITGRMLPPHLKLKQKYGIMASLVTQEYCRSLPEHKTGNYLAPWLARNKADSHQAAEAILVDATGNWLETATGNLWGWRDGCWWTPPLSGGILPGIMRFQLLKWLQSHHSQVIEAPWSVKLVTQFEAIAYSNCVVELLPIHTVIFPQGSLKYKSDAHIFSQLREFFLA